MKELLHRTLKIQPIVPGNRSYIPQNFRNNDKVTVRRQVLLQKLKFFELHKKFPHFIEPECSLPYCKRKPYISFIVPAKTQQFL